MDLKNRIRKFQEKKLDEALIRLEYHSSMKIDLEKKLNSCFGDERSEVEKEITHHSKMKDIWKNNVDKIKKEISKLN